MIQKRRRLIGCVIFIAFTIYTITEINNRYFKDINFIYINDNTHAVCVLPKLDPFDPSIMKFVYKPKPIVCDQSLSFVFVDSGGLLQINETALKLSPYDNVKCVYSVVNRDGDYDVKTGPEFQLTSPTDVQADFFRVKCMSNAKLLYDFVHHKVEHNQLLKLEKESRDKLNVFIFGFDSTSRSAAERKLQKTLSYLQNDLKGYVMKGYTKVGENTFPNLLALLTGKEPYSEELPPYTEILDPYPFIWNNFSNNGYATLLAEDCPEMPSFQYWKGFRQAPCHHYFRPYRLAINKMKPFADKSTYQSIVDVLTTSGSALCYGNTAKHKLVINYYKQFIETYKANRKFALSWMADLSHEDNSLLELADDDTADFFKWMKNNGHLKNSILILLSDHGAIMNNIRNTPIGRIENRMPIFGMVIPDELKIRYSHLHTSLSRNTERLTSPYDLYETMSDILRGHFSRRSSASTGKSLSRGISLFKEIPKDRTCFDAGIHEHYCPCYSTENISVSDQNVKNIATFITQTINGYFVNEKEKCAHLRLKKITDAVEIKTSNFRRDKNKEEFSFKKYFVMYDENIRYQIEIETVPGHGLFEATVEFHEDNSMKLLGDISRTNKYGNQSVCVEKQLRPFCYCIK